MDNDDLPVGRLLSRRDAVRLITSATVLVAGGRRLAGAESLHTEGPRLGPACVAKPELTEGPYFVDEKLNRSDIRGEPGGGALTAGAPFSLAFAVSRLDGKTCAPISGAMVDVWHCDASGIYSDSRDPGFDTSGKKVLRGYQLTDESGIARSMTIIPGWYHGRTVHIHFKIRTKSATNAPYEFTSQLFFDDAFSNRLFAEHAAYKRSDRRDTMNADDDIFRESRGQLTIPVAKSGNGLASTFDIALDLSDAEVGKPDGMGGRGGPGGRRGGPPPRRPPEGF
jgi:protocatechuate 3,4-dioxygenase beta subunit